MNNQQKSTPQPRPVADILDLDKYRDERLAEGTWPPTREDQMKFFSQFVKKDKKSD